MNFRRKLSAIVETIETEGGKGVARVVAQSLVDYLSCNLAESIYEDKLLYRYGSCNDLITLKAKYLKLCLDYKQSSSHGWGLKQLGTLFCLEKYNQIKPAKILEVGAGYNTFFDENIGQESEYWMIDDVGFYDETKFNIALDKRNNTKFIKGLLGSDLIELPESYFEFIFSISVLEHVPLERLSNVYADMYKILRSGGVIVHSIDLSSVKQARQHYLKLKEAGFILTSNPDMHRYFSGDMATLFEPVDIVFNYYWGIRDDMWQQPRPFYGYTPTMLVYAKKP